MLKKIAEQYLLMFIKLNPNREDVKESLAVLRDGDVSLAANMLPPNSDERRCLEEVDSDIQITDFEAKAHACRCFGLEVEERPKEDEFSSIHMMSHILMGQIMGSLGELENPESVCCIRNRLQVFATVLSIDLDWVDAAAEEAACWDQFEFNNFLLEKAPEQDVWWTRGCLREERVGVLRDPHVFI